MNTNPDEEDALLSMEIGQVFQDSKRRRAARRTPNLTEEMIFNSKIPTPCNDLWDEREARK